MSPTIPRRLGRYEVIELLGTGAFATVFRARDDRLDADVAIKVLAENHSFDPDLRERFISEGHLLRRVDSPHVVKVFDLGETVAGQPFLVLDLAAGGDLAARRRGLGGHSPTLADLLAVAAQVAAALGALHGERVVHRDVTPGNLLIHGHANGRPPTAVLGAGERLMLADLGLSKDLAVASGLTKGAGTTGFTPPEQGAGSWVDPRADIWSASALLVWLILGAAPDPGGAWHAELTERGWPPGLLDELGRGLANGPDDRHQTAEAWVAALQEAARPPVAPPPPVDGSVPAGESRCVSLGPPEERRPRRPVLVGGLGLLVLLLVTGGWLLGRASVSGSPPYGRTRTERLAGGQVRATARLGPARVAITGPESVRVGQRAEYRSETSGVVGYRWLAPDGRSYEDEPTLIVDPTSEGTATVRLLGQSAEGDVVVAEVRVTVGRRT